MWLSNSENPPPSQKPYLLRGIYQWLEDHEFTPHLIVAYPAHGWVSGVPEALLKENILVLNISSRATRNLEMGSEALFFETRFSGESHQVAVNYQAVLGLVSRENQEGIQFALPENFPELRPDNTPPRKKFTVL